MKQTLRTILQTAPVGIGMVVDRVFQWVSGQIETMLGYSADELLGEDTSLIYPSKEDYQRVGEHQYGEIAQGRIGEIETRFKRKDGKVIDILLRSRPIDPQNPDKGIIFAALDITERKQTGEALRESEVQLRLLAENMADIIWTTDLDFRTTYVSPSVEKVLGFTPEERKSQSLAEMVTPESLEAIRARFADEFQGEGTAGRDMDRSLTVETEYYKKDGSTLWLENKVKWIQDSQGNIAGILGVSRDISERKRAEKEREELEAQLRQAQKMESLGQLAGGVAHDFNNLLTTILGNVELIEMLMAKNRPVADNLAEIGKAANSAATLVRQLLAFSRKQVVQPRVLNVSEMIGAMFKLFRRLIGEDITLELKPSPAVPAIRMDPGQLEQVMVNLVVNARDAMPQGGKVVIETTRVDLDREFFDRKGLVPAPGTYVRISVKDAGEGMSPEVRGRVFEPFFTTKTLGRGTGLGLATVYGIMKQNHGYIWVKSKPGEGSTFDLYLPATEVEEKKPEDPASKRISDLSGSGTILVVEDDDFVRDVSCEMLQILGYSTLSARDMDEAEEISKEHEGRIDLLLADVVLPKGSGREVAEELAAFRPGMKVLFMSGHTDNVITHHGVLEPGIEFIQKPFAPAELGKRVREVLGKH